MIGYRFGVLPHLSIHMSSGYNAAITTKPYYFSHFSTKPHLSFSHSSSSLPKSSRGRPPGHILGPITFTAGHPSTSLQKSWPPQAQDFTAGHLEKVEEVAKELKGSRHQDISLKLLKMHDPQLDINADHIGYYKIKTGIMQILIDEKKVNDALTYSRDIEEKKSNFPQDFNFDEFNKLKEKLYEILNEGGTPPTDLKAT